jgi:hypothetical protein
MPIAQNQGWGNSVGGKALDFSIRITCTKIAEK